MQGDAQGTGSRELARGTAAYLACLTFVLTYLLTTALGATGLTATLRGAIVAAFTYCIGRTLLRPLTSSLLDAMARDRAARSTEERDE